MTLPSSYQLDTRILEGEKLRGTPPIPVARILARGGHHYLAYSDSPQERLGTWKSGFAPKGIALDIGTTTLVAGLMDLESGTELATASMVNPQTRFGHDVLSRIQKGSTSEGLAELRNVIIGALNSLIDRLCKVAGSDQNEIVDIVLAGNTAMLQIAAGIDPTPLGLVPFTVGIQGGRHCPAADIGALIANPLSRLYLPPVAHAYVGTDVSAGLLACGFFDTQEPALFIDIGTNGELGLNTCERVLVTSAAAGPAFEGMGISHGCRARGGAIESVRIENGTLRCSTIGDEPAIGICGSGVIDLIACLLDLGEVSPAGRMVGEHKGPPGPRAADTLDSPSHWLSEKVYFTQADVRQVQLAKGAIRTAIEMLLEETGTDPRSIGTVFLAGAFGRHLQPASLERIGLLPPGLADKVAFAGNTSKLGASMLLINRVLREKLESEMQSVKHLPLAERPSFEDKFVENLLFPNRS